MLDFLYNVWKVYKFQGECLLAGFLCLVRYVFTVNRMSVIYGKLKSYTVSVKMVNCVSVTYGKLTSFKVSIYGRSEL